MFDCIFVFLVYNCNFFTVSFPFLPPEAGLKSALEATEALYSGTIESLSRLSADDVTRIFKDATVKEIFLKPGITVLDLSLEIPCFKSQGK